VADRRHANAMWTIDMPPTGTMPFGGAQLAVLMDIRDALQALNRVLHCPNFLGIPKVLRDIRLNTARAVPRRVRPSDKHKKAMSRARSARRRA
jgi:hypothetical protein